MTEREWLRQKEGQKISEGKGKTESKMMQFVVIWIVVPRWQIYYVILLVYIRGDAKNFSLRLILKSVF